MVELNTEKEILKAAREIFVLKGKDGTRMQEIADRAGVNKTLLHYYFRSKENLFLNVVFEAKKELFSSVLAESAKEKTFKSFLEIFIERHINFLKEHIDVFRFFAWELHKDSSLAEKLKKLHKESGLESKPEQVFQQKITDAVKEGEIRQIDGKSFFMNLLSLDIFFLIALPMLCSFGVLKSEEIDEFIETRKKEIFRLLWNDLKINK